VDQTANFGHAPLLTQVATRNVTLDAARTVGSINFNNTLQVFNIVGSNTLTMDVTTGSANLNVAAGSHSIQTPVTLLDNTSVFVNTGSSLNITGAVNVGTNSITKSGGGTAQFANIRSTGNVTVSQGTLTISEKAGSPSLNTAGTSKVNSLSIATGAAVDLTNNSMIIDYTAGGLNALITSTRSDLANGRLKTSLTDRSHLADPSDAAHPRNLGYADGAALNYGTGGGQTTSFAGVTLTDSDNLLIKYTWSGDSNLDGKVDVTDLGNLALAWNGTGQQWRTGDFNYDGNVNVSDLYLLAQNWQQGVSTPALGPDLNLLLASFGLPTAVPEPTSIGLIGMGLVGALSARRRRKA
jgi:hypothetical protein